MAPGAGFGNSGREQLTTAALIDALAASIGRPLRLKVRREQQELVLSITACEARGETLRSWF